MTDPTPKAMLKAKDIYDAACAAAWTDYNAAVDPAWLDYWKATALWRAAYDAAVAPYLARYHEIYAQANTLRESRLAEARQARRIAEGVEVEAEPEDEIQEEAQP